MPSLRFLTVTLLAIVWSAPSFACEPCIAKTPLERTVSQSSVIVLVKNDDQDSSADLEKGPDVVNLTIEKVMRGPINTSTIKVRSWYGACAYGVHLKVRERALLMLQEMTDVSTGQWDGTYKLVEEGCSEGQLDVRGEFVWVNNNWLPISSFVSKYISSFFW